MSDRIQAYRLGDCRGYGPHADTAIREPAGGVGTRASEVVTACPPASVTICVDTAYPFCETLDGLVSLAPYLLAQVGAFSMRRLRSPAS